MNNISLYTLLLTQRRSTSHMNQSQKKGILGQQSIGPGFQCINSFPVSNRTKVKRVAKFQRNKCIKHKTPRPRLLLSTNTHISIEQLKSISQPNSCYLITHGNHLSINHELNILTPSLPLFVVFLLGLSRLDYFRRLWSSWCCHTLKLGEFTRGLLIGIPKPYTFFHGNGTSKRK